MNMTAERRPDTEAELQYENPFADLPTYEELQQQRQRRTQHEQDTSTQEVFDNPFADDYVPKHSAENQPQEQAEQPQEQSERRIVSRRLLKAGERSTIYKIEMSDGKEGTELESDYHEIAGNFRKQHEDLKKDFSLDLCMIGFSTDLALVDATRGDCLNDANADQRAALLEDYSKLRGRLDNPNTPAAEKQLITEYLDQMKGSALDFIQAQYEQSKDGNSQNERLKAELEELKDTLERSRRNFEDSYQDFEKAIKLVNELLQDSRYFDELPQALRRLSHAIEDAFDAAKKYRNSNNDYGDLASRSKSSLNEEEYHGIIRSCDDAEETIQQALKKLSNADEFAHDTTRKVNQLLNF